jgi:hypothetical protein
MPDLSALALQAAAKARAVSGKVQFKAPRPGQLHVADFTHVPLAGGRFAYP